MQVSREAEDPIALSPGCLLQQVCLLEFTDRPCRGVVRHAELFLGSLNVSKRMAKQKLEKLQLRGTESAGGANCLLSERDHFLCRFDRFKPRLLNALQEEFDPAFPVTVFPHCGKAIVVLEPVPFQINADVKQRL